MYNAVIARKVIFLTKRRRGDTISIIIAKFLAMKGIASEERPRNDNAL
jgi:hypothetical protein